MSERTAIAWCDSTFNPWIGCTKVSQACDRCYAERKFGTRFGVPWGAGQPRRRTSASNWTQPLRWQRQAAEFRAQHGRRRRVFCASLSDVFDNEVPDGWRMDLFKLIADTPDLDWLLLTKRVGNVARYLQNDGLAFDAISRSVWLGITVCNQAEVDRDIPKLLAVPAARRFLSVEPMLGPISLRWLSAWPENAPNIAESPTRRTDHLDGLRRLDWIICGGESGPHARPMHPDWPRSLRDQCAAAGVPFFLKQIGEWASVFDRDHDDPDWGDCGKWKSTHPNGRWMNLAGGHGFHGDRVQYMDRLGVKVAGRMLDGVEHLAWPESAA